MQLRNIVRAKTYSLPYQSHSW